MGKKSHFLAAFLLSFALISLSDAAYDSIVSFPQTAPPSFRINSTAQPYHSLSTESCDFSVTIVTSCSSPSPTRDQVSITFGDAYGNQVYAPRLHDPFTRTFERCSSDTYQVYGPCTHQICYLYIYRSGYDGWIPRDIMVSGANTMEVTFRYKDVPIPADIWYGFDYCSSGGAVVKAKSILVSVLVSVLVHTIGGGGPVRPGSLL
ncbi:unnamed protein product [Cuscuta epithymum]|uniref:Uncharacterized protein n=1 Tax=Cuscuta epithymum TaxID=186058 RepID=A0AAV0CGR7_9ASTE|nr:unnamed protein product [Cuscuta epithymum]